MRYVVIMAGGSGTRLWPLSRKGMPKQLLDLVGGTSLLRMAYDRVAQVVPPAQILVCTGAAYASVVTEQIPELLPENLLGEPVGRDSLNAVAWPAAVLAARDPDAVVAMVSADHLISPVAEFASALDAGLTIAEQFADVLVTFGVVPTAPHIGYGYLHRGADLPGHPGACELQQFKEKPDAATAEAYLASGEYWWNSGTFAWRAATLLQALAELVPDSYRVVTEIADAPEKLAGLYPQLPKISVDFALLEPVSAGQGGLRIIAVPLSISWADVGGFAALAENLPHDESGNAVDGQALLLETAGSLVVNRTGDRHLVAVLGADDLVVVTTPDVTLVCPIAATERIKELVNQVAAEIGPDFT